MLTKVDMAAIAVGQGIWHWIVRLGAFGFIPLGIADASVIPLPGSMDVLTVVLASREKELWPYYAAMATLGSVIGGYFTYRLALKGGEETFEKRTSPRMVQKVRRLFGLRRNRSSSITATACADGSVRHGRRRSSISVEKVSLGAHLGPAGPLFAAELLRCALR